MPPFRYAAILLLAGTAACSGSQSASERSSPTAGSVEAARTAAVDLPALMGRNIDQVRRKLGPPKEGRDQSIGLEPTAEQMQATKGQDWINTFDQSGLTIVTTFNARTRKVRDMVVVGNDEDEILRRANLSLTAPNYMVLPVADPSNSRAIIGMRVVDRK
ncbi:hypothetical protein KLP40_11355 [Hymenobacter sp. NST-14]|uniref:hypothetical protein n=1 Tax=Hymenobacter piscis TaxID=2839984 RepID=UPI001C015630|nr:hypothetical protein [Hymenobacter piscis]MBT9393760.1 hypothetical protein [Hymenobacter piscis]